MNSHPLVDIAIYCLRPVPWSAPQVFMKSRKGGGSKYKSALRNPDLTDWQAYVRLHAEAAMLAHEVALTTGPVLANLTFRRATDDPDLHGRCWFHGVEWRQGKDDKPGEYVKMGETVPDADNLAKGTLDALQGVVFGNDVQVCILTVARLYGAADACEIMIHTLDDTAF